MILCENCKKREATVEWYEYGSEAKHLCINCYKKSSRKNIKDEFLDGLSGLSIT